MEKTATQFDSLPTFISSKKAEFEKELAGRFNPKNSGATNDLLGLYETSLTSLANEMMGLVPEEKATLDMTAPVSDRERDVDFWKAISHNDCREETLRRMREYLSGNEENHGTN